MNHFDGIKDWWNQTSVRDQLALVVLGGIVAIYLTYAMVLKPVMKMREKQEIANSAQLQTLERVRDLASQWANRNGDDAGGKGGSLVEMVDNSLKQHNLALSNMQPSGNESVRLRLESVSFNSLIAWLNEMETRQRLQIKDLSIANSRDAGLVSANLRLQQD